MASFGGASIREAFEADADGVSEYCAVYFPEPNSLQIENCSAGAMGIGIAQQTANGGGAVDVIVFGLALAKLGGTVAAMDALTSDSNGRLVAATSTDYIIARACFAGVSGDVTTVLVNHEGLAGEGATPPAASTDVVDIDFIAASDLSAMQYQFVQISGTEVDALYPSALGRCVGVLQNTPTMGQTATVRVLGRSQIALSMTLTTGALVGNAGILDPEGDVDHSGRAIQLDSETGGFCMGVIITGGDVDEIGEMMVQVEGFTIG